mmetsp:Transcript_18657/g.26322  ORF Transcript_18657/g.26322 Transcript_18657/m.26322 type:complete len:652 (+) Transcript_18657:51-2006(+)
MGVIEHHVQENPNSPEFTSGVAVVDRIENGDDAKSDENNNTDDDKAATVEEVAGATTGAEAGKGDDQPVAVVVDQEELKQEIRDRLFEGAPAAEPVAFDKWKKWHVWGAILTTILVITTIIGLSVGLTKARKEDGEDDGSLPTLELIKKKGFVRCAIGWHDELEEDLCKAFAAAVLGNSSAYEVVKIGWGERWPILQNRSVDIVTLMSTLTMDREVHQADSGTGYSFSIPFFYDGAVFGGVPEYVDCADKRNAFFGKCKGVRVCITEGSSTYDVISDFLPDAIFRPSKYEDMIEGLKDSTCNVFVEGSFDVSEHRVRENNFTGDYKVGTNFFSKSPLSTVVREDDQQWADFVNWVIKAFFVAEQQNITDANAEEFMTTDLFGLEYKNMFINAIAAVGNYEQLYTKYFSESVPRGGLNLINNGSTALLYAPPFGTIQKKTVGVVNSTMIENIHERGVLHCGKIQGEVWSELGAAYCDALAASLFKENASKVEFIEISDDEEGLSMLDSGEIDVLSGGRVNLQDDVGGATEAYYGHTFSLPYFYKGNDEIALVTREDDPKWSDFVYWTVAATFYADEYKIKQDFYLDMPKVQVFGSHLEDMFQQAIKAVGNYREMHDAHVGADVDQDARNNQNLNPYTAQIHVPYYDPPKNMG